MPNMSSEPWWQWVEFDAVHSYERCEGSMNELLYYFIKHCQCSSGDKRKLAQTHSVAEATSVPRTLPLTYCSIDNNYRHHDMMNGEQNDKAVVVTSRSHCVCFPGLASSLGLDCRDAAWDCRLKLRAGEEYQETTRLREEVESRRVPLQRLHES